MPTVSLVRPASSAAPARHPKAVIVSEHGHKVVLPFAPEDAQLTGFGWDWSTQARTGRKPLVRKGNHRLKVYSYSPMLCDPDPQLSVEPVLTALRYLVDLGERVSWTGMGPSEHGLFRLSLDSITPVRRQRGTNFITQCRIGLTFTEAVDAVSKVGPLTGGVGGAAGAGAPVPVKPSGRDPGLMTPGNR